MILRTVSSMNRAALNVEEAVESVGLIVVHQLFRV